MNNIKNRLDLSRIDMILKHPLFIDNIDLINQCEEDRIYCKHGISHLYDVARIGRIIIAENLKEYGMLSVEIFYAMSFLHDIGRGMEYMFSLSHDEESVKIASIILKECNYSDDEIKTICDAISSHRGEQLSCLDASITESYIQVLKTADNESRRCYVCPAFDECYWSEDRKNMSVRY